MVSSDASLPHPDQQFVDRLRTDDRRVWSEIYEINRPKVVSYLLRRNVPVDVAGEIFQETLLLLDQRKASLTLTSKLSVFLIGVAIRKLKEYWKKQGKSPEQLTDDVEQLDRAAGGDDTLEATQLALLQLAFDDDEALLGMEMPDPDRLIQHALTSLSERCRVIFRMRFWENLNDYQIAEAMPMEYHLVRNQFYKCKEKIREILRHTTYPR